MTLFPRAKLLSARCFVLFCSWSCTSASARASRCHPSREEEIRQREFEEGQKEIGFIIPAVRGVWQLQGQSRQRPASCTPQWSPAQREKGQLPLDPRRQADVSAAIYADARLGFRYSSECEHLEVSQMSNFELVQTPRAPRRRRACGGIAAARMFFFSSSFPLEECFTPLQECEA